MWVLDLLPLGKILGLNLHNPNDFILSYLDFFFHIIDLEIFGLLARMFEIKGNFPNSTYNRTGTYNRNLREGNLSLLKKLKILQCVD